MSSPVLVLSNDFSPAAARTSRHLCRALGRLGYTAAARDTRLVRWAAAQMEQESPVRRDAYENAVVVKWHRLIHDYGFETVISLDLHWLFTAKLFLPSTLIRAIHSLWLGDPAASLPGSPAFPPAPATVPELINEAKLTHHASGRGPMEELRRLGAGRVRPTAPGAPAEYLDAAEPCTERGRIAFLGDPGLAAPPSPRARQALDRGEDLAALRRLARTEILDGLGADAASAAWLKVCPPVAGLLAAATELRLAQPHTPAVALLARAAPAFADALAFLEGHGALLEAAQRVKAVNRYDRAGLVRRLDRRGWLDIYGAPEAWAACGVAARPSPDFSGRAAALRRYAVHLHAPDGTRDAAPGEDVFEIAACGRLSLGLDHPELRACYTPEEVALVQTDDALEAEAGRVLRDTEAALARGEAARAHTAREHLWDHRLTEALS